MSKRPNKNLLHGICAYHCVQKRPQFFSVLPKVVSLSPTPYLPSALNFVCLLWTEFFLFWFVPFRWSFFPLLSLSRNPSFGRARHALSWEGGGFKTMHCLALTRNTCLPRTHVPTWRFRSRDTSQSILPGRGSSRWRKTYKCQRGRNKDKRNPQRLLVLGQKYWHSSASNRPPFVTDKVAGKGAFHERR